MDHKDDYFKSNKSYSYVMDTKTAYCMSKWLDDIAQRNKELETKITSLKTEIIEGTEKHVIKCEVDFNGKKFMSVGLNASKKVAEQKAKAKVYRDICEAFGSDEVVEMMSKKNLFKSLFLISLMSVELFFELLKLSEWPFIMMYCSLSLTTSPILLIR